MVLRFKKRLNQNWCSVFIILPKNIAHLHVVILLGTKQSHTVLNTAALILLWVSVAVCAPDLAIHVGSSPGRRCVSWHSVFGLTVIPPPALAHSDAWIFNKAVSLSFMNLKLWHQGDCKVTAQAVYGFLRQPLCHRKRRSLWPQPLPYPSSQSRGHEIEAFKKCSQLLFFTDVKDSAQSGCSFLVGATSQERELNWFSGRIIILFFSPCRGTGCC